MSFATDFELGVKIKGDIAIIDSMLAVCPALEVDTPATAEQVSNALAKLVETSYAAFDDEDLKESKDAVLTNLYNTIRTHLTDAKTNREGAFSELDGAA